MVKTKEVTVQYKVFDSFEDLPKEVKSLMNKAIEAREKAYAIYSNFKVGAAVLLGNKEVVIGSNQENAAFPSGLCAERVAIFQASSLYPNEKIKIIAISGSSENPTNEPVSPCGACRQSMAEYEIRQQEAIVVFFMGASGKVVQVNSIHDLLPFSF